MVLELKAILNGVNKEIKINTTLDYCGEEYRGEKIFASPVIVEGSVSNKADITQLSLCCKVHIEKLCDRCGKPTNKVLTIPIERVLVRSLVGEEHDDIIVIENDKLNLFDFCFEEILLALPMKFLCDENCKGICTLCGTNLNNGECHCNKKKIDPRLEALAKLLKDDTE